MKAKKLPHGVYLDDSGKIVVMSRKAYKRAMSHRGTGKGKVRHFSRRVRA